MTISTAEVNANVRKAFGSAFSTEAVQDSDMLRYIASAINRLCKEKNWGFNQFTTTVTTNGLQTEYSIPYQIETFYVRGSDGADVDFLSFDEYWSKTPDINDVMIEGERLMTSKADTFTIIYRGFVTPPTDLNSTIDIPNMFQSAIEQYATKEAFRIKKDWESMRATYDEYNLEINRASARNTNVRPRTGVRFGANRKG